MGKDADSFIVSYRDIVDLMGKPRPLRGPVIELPLSVVAAIRRFLGLGPQDPVDTRAGLDALARMRQEDFEVRP